MYVADDPVMTGPLAAFAASVEPGRLHVVSVAEIYGDSGCVDAAQQRAMFASAVAAALDSGFDGMRVAADNSCLVIDAERRDAWCRWEHTADAFMSQHPVIGLCAFDRARVELDVLRHLATMHPLFSASGPVPRFRVFVDAGALWLEGEIDRFAIDEATKALADVPHLRKLVVDLTGTARVLPATISRLDEISTSGVDVTVLTDSAAVYEAGDELVDRDGCENHDRDLGRCAVAGLREGRAFGEQHDCREPDEGQERRAAPAS
jgi:hypothetical protein